MPDVEGFSVIRSELDAYRQGKGGYGINAEGSQPVGMHIMCAVFSLSWLASLRDIPHAGKVTDYQHFRAVLAWLEKIRLPSEYHTITRAEGAQMAAHNPPGHGAEGAERYIWRGADWQDNCPLLAGPVRVSIAQAMPPDEPFSLPLLVKTWRLLAERIQASPIIGEKEG